MGLSYDLISEFVKITNDKKENTKEGTVYATVVSGTGGKYVQIDGSDLLTPMDTTTDIEDGERVTLMIKDHKAIVTGNVTTPSASTSKVDKVTESINSVSDRVGTFELVVADKISTKELEAYKATIEVLVAKKATIEDLTATNAKIENLEVKNAEIENLVAEKATITDLEAVNATIENLKATDAEIENAVVENLKATTADIKILNADFAQIKTLVNGNLTSDNILSFNLTSGKVTVDDAFIKDAMIDTISAGKINAGKINTNSVSIGSEDGGMLITGSTQQFTDKNGNVRIQIGKDASGDFTFILYGEDGKGQLINQNGIMASAISDGLIVNDMVSDHAAISGGKLDISSVISEINSDNSTTIKSSKIYLNDQAQSLEVAFNSLKTQVDTIQEVTIQGDLTAIVEQVQSNTSKIEANKNSINTLISEDTVIKKQVTDLQGTLNETETTLNSKYTALNQNLDGFKTTVADTYATKKSVTDVVDNIETNYSTTSVMNSAIKQKAQEISASVSSTYATKNQVNTLDNNLKTNYSTTQEMESAINVAKEAINLGVSTIYETKENVESKVNNIKVGGTNLLPGTKLLTAGIRSNSFITSDTYLGFKIAHHKQTDGNYTDIYRFDSYISVEPNTEYTLSFYAKGIGSVASYLHPNAVAYGENSIGNTTNTHDGSILTTVTNEWKRYWITWKTLSNASGLKSLIIGRINKGNDIYICGAKFEKGNKATEWSPAPEDIDTSINNAKTEAITSANNTLTSTISNYYTKSQTDSQINVAKEAINLGVSTNYETKTNVQSKVTSTLNSAKSYADTKKSEAINTAASDATSKANNAKSEAIKSANNTLTSTISNYYTKSQTDSQINIAKEAINLGVSTIYETKENVESKVNNIKVGGRNYLINSDFSKAEKFSVQAKNPDLYPVGWGAYNPGIPNPTTSYHAHIDKDTFGYNVIEYNESDGNRIWKAVNQGNLQTRISTSGTFTFSVDMYATGSGTCLYGGFYYCLKGGTSYNFHSGQFYIASADIPVNKWGRRSIKCQLGDNVDFSKGITFYVYGYNFSSNSILYIKNVKLEFGNKATDWQNGMEDTKTDIQNAKTEAITSANNNTSNVIKNYYTKAQTDSQINVAKNAITQSVSSTYATKTNVTSSINGVNSSISNLQNRMSSAESKITDTAITNTVKKNFYTKTETENAITSKKYATQSQVQQTAENIEFKFTQSGGYNLIRNGGFENGTKYWSRNGNFTDGKDVWLPYGNGTSWVIWADAWSGFYQFFNCRVGQTYSWSMDVYVEHGYFRAGVEDISEEWYRADNGWVKMKGTFTATRESHAFILYAAENHTTVHFDNVMVCEGSIPSAYTPHPSEIYEGIIQMDKDGIKVSTSNGGWTDFTSLGMNVYNKSNKLSLGTRNGGLTYHGGGAYLGFTSESIINAYNTRGVSISTATDGAYISLGHSSATDPFGGFTSTPYLSVAKQDIGDSSSFYRQGVNVHTTLNLNTQHINRMGTINFATNNTSKIYESTVGNLCMFGDNGAVLGYREGNNNVTKLEILEGSDKSTSDIHSYAHWRFHQWSLTDVGQIEVVSRLKMLGTSSIHFNANATHPSAMWHASGDGKLKIFGDNGVDIGYREGDTNRPIFQITEGVDGAYRLKSFSHWHFNNWNLDYVGNVHAQKFTIAGTSGSY